MLLIIIIFLIPVFYTTLTLMICSFYDLKTNDKKYIFPIRSLAYESLLQYFVFLILPFEVLIRWESYNSQTNKFVILLPGYSETQFIFWKIRKKLKKSNVGFKTIRYRPFLGDLVKLSNDLKNEIEIVLENNYNAEIFIIGHSMGGLIGRYFMENSNCKNIKSLIMIATPHKGTYLSKFGIGRCAKQLIPNSNFIKGLGAKPIKNAKNFYSQGDSLICPRHSAIYFENNTIIKNRPLHNSCLFFDETVNLIMDII